MEEMVKVMVMGIDSSMIPVSVNGKCILVPKNVEVEIPKPYFRVLKNMSVQLRVVQGYVEALESNTDANMAGTGKNLAGVRPPKVKAAPRAPLVV